MTKPLFDKKDFVLCEVPVPKGYPQSQTHAGVYQYKGNLYLTTSPYPLIKHSRWYYYLIAIFEKLHLGLFLRAIDADKYENPLLYVAEDGSKSKFRLMQDRPLMETPVAYYNMPAYNSDPDLFIENDTFYVLNRSYFRKQLQKGKVGCDVWLYLIRGKLDNDKFKLDSTTLLKEWDKSTVVSPCLTSFNGLYYMFYLDTNSALDKKTFSGLYCYRGDTIDTIFDNDCREVAVVGDGILPWHMSVFNYGKRLYAIVASVIKGQEEKLWQLLGEFSEDMSSLRIFRTPLTDYNSYRGSAYIDDGGMFYLYNATLRERIRGSKSVDGRDVILASRPFEDVLKYVVDNESEV